MVRNDSYYASALDRQSATTQSQPTQQEMAVNQEIMRQYNQAIAEAGGSSEGLESFDVTTEETEEGTVVRSQYSIKQQAPAPPSPDNPVNKPSNADTMKYLGFMGVENAGDIVSGGNITEGAEKREDFYVVPATARLLDFADQIRGQQATVKYQGFMAVSGSGEVGTERLEDRPEFEVSDTMLKANALEIMAGGVGSVEGFWAPTVPTLWGLASPNEEVRGQTVAFMQSRPHYALGSVFGEVGQAVTLGYIFGGTQSALRLGLPTKADLKADAFALKNLFSREPRTIMQGYHELGGATVRQADYIPFEGGGSYWNIRDTLKGDIRMSDTVINVPTRYVEPDGTRLRVVSDVDSSRSYSYVKDRAGVKTTDLEVGDDFMKRHTVSETVDVRARTFTHVDETSEYHNLVVKRMGTPDDSIKDIFVADSQRLVPQLDQPTGLLRGTGEGMKLTPTSGFRLTGGIIPKVSSPLDRSRFSGGDSTRWVTRDFSGMGIVPKIGTPEAPPKEIIFLDPAEDVTTFTGVKTGFVPDEDTPAPPVPDVPQEQKMGDPTQTIKLRTPTYDKTEWDVMKAVKNVKAGRRYSEYMNPFNMDIIKVTMPAHGFRMPRGMTMTPFGQHRHRKGRRG